MSADQEEYDAERASLIESFHYTLGKEALAIEEEYNHTIQFSREFVHCLNEFVFDFTERLGVDLESFARHAKRSTVQIEDVLLCARRNSSLQELLLAFAKDEITGKKTSAKKPKAQVEDEEEVDDDIVEIDKLDESDREDDEDLVPAKKRKLIKTSRRKSKAAIENSVLLDDFDQDEDFDDW